MLTVLTEKPCLFGEIRFATLYFSKSFVRGSFPKFVVLSNLIGVMPVTGTIGRIEAAEEYCHHQEEKDNLGHNVKFNVCNEKREEFVRTILNSGSSSNLLTRMFKKKN